MPCVVFFVRSVAEWEMLAYLFGSAVELLKHSTDSDWLMHGAAPESRHVASGERGLGFVWVTCGGRSRERRDGRFFLANGAAVALLHKHAA